MTSPIAIPVCRPMPVRDRHLSRRAAFALQASITMSFLAGSAAPTPLYPIYQAAWGFSSVATTIVFGIYALAVLATLLVLGRLSDHVGRRPVLLVATLMQIVAMLVLTTADGLGGLLLGRVVQGLATGGAVGAVGAGLLDIDRQRGTTANAIAPIMGTATGALLGGLAAHFLPAPTHLTYCLLIGVFALQAVGIVFMRETIAPIPGALASLKPNFSAPPAVRAPMLLAIPVLVASWSLAGFYGALGPALVRGVLGLDSTMYGGVALFVLAGSGGAAVLCLQARDARALMIASSSLLMLGVGGVLVSLHGQSIAGFFAATIVAGMGFGAGFQGAVRTVLRQAAAHERAGVLSVTYVVSYLSMGLLAVFAGYFVTHGQTLMVAATGFGATIVLLAAFALVGTLRSPSVASA